jgi:hypothetical protein
MTEITVTGFVRDEGSLVLLKGLADSEQELVFAVEHRYAPAILAAFEADEEPVVVDVPDYLIVGQA